MRDHGASAVIALCVQYCDFSTQCIVDALLMTVEAIVLSVSGQH